MLSPVKTADQTLLKQFDRSVSVSVKGTDDMQYSCITQDIHQCERGLCKSITHSVTPSVDNGRRY